MTWRRAVRRLGRVAVVVAVWLVVGGFYWFAGSAAWRWYSNRPGDVMEEHISEDLGVGCVTYKDAMHCVYLQPETNQ
jgi:hypothetical protein